ncbi:hypothetical protein VTL71DRAFT_10444 [Oculimacula yallundae]|uniref:Uncharacterized protein n=1 Tax=Oculimacula yallundae TaxID=86028 RepID=A0ABR4CTE1_9HELO
MTPIQPTRLTDQRLSHIPDALRSAGLPSNHHRHHRQVDTSFLLSIDIQNPTTFSSPMIRTRTSIYRDALGYYYLEPLPGRLPQSKFLRVINLPTPATPEALFYKIRDLAKWQDRNSLGPWSTIRDVELSYIFVAWDLVNNGPQPSSQVSADDRTYLPADDDDLGADILDMVAKRGWKDVIHVQYERI